MESLKVVAPGHRRTGMASAGSKVTWWRFILVMGWDRWGMHEGDVTCTKDGISGGVVRAEMREGAESVVLEAGLCAWLPR